MAKNHMTAKESISRLTKMGLLVALSVVLVLLIRIPIFPAAPYLIYDMADVPILLGAFLLGPVAGLEILLVVSGIQAFLLSPDGIIGMIMHFFASGVLILVSYGIYKLGRKTTRSMILGLILGTAAMAATMVPLNLIFTVYFYGVPKEAVVALLVPIIIPFNLIKAGANSILLFLIFKSIRFIFKEHKQKLLESNMTK